MQIPIKSTTPKRMKTSVAPFLGPTLRNLILEDYDGNWPQEQTVGVVKPCCKACQITSKLYPVLDGVSLLSCTSSDMINDLVFAGVSLALISEAHRAKIEALEMFRVDAERILLPFPP